MKAKEADKIKLAEGRKMKINKRVKNKEQRETDKEWKAKEREEKNQRES